VIGDKCSAIDVIRDFLEDEKNTKARYFDVQLRCGGLRRFSYKFQEYYNLQLVCSRRALEDEKATKACYFDAHIYGGFSTAAALAHCDVDFVRGAKAPLWRQRRNQGQDTVTVVCACGLARICDRKVDVHVKNHASLLPSLPSFLLSPSSLPTTAVVSVSALLAPSLRPRLLTGLLCLSQRARGGIGSGSSSRNSNSGSSGGGLAMLECKQHLDPCVQCPPFCLGTSMIYLSFLPPSHPLNDMLAALLGDVDNLSSVSPSLPPLSFVSPSPPPTQ
jgi:hypothetical protein